MHGIGREQRKRARARRADAPAVLRHARADAELARLQKLDAIGIDDDIERRARNAHEDRGERDGHDIGLWVHKPEIDDRNDHKRRREQHPRDALAEPPKQRQTHAFHHPRPQELEIVREEHEREGGDAFLVDTVLRQARGERCADHRIGKARRHAEEQRGERRGFEIGADTCGKTVPNRCECARHACSFILTGCVCKREMAARESPAFALGVGEVRVR